jgi:hypothetical protein
MAPECDTPSEVKWLWWEVLEKGQCLQGNIQYYGDYNNTSYSYTLIEDMETDTMIDSDTQTKQGKNVSSFIRQYILPVSAILFIFGTTGNIILIIIIISNKDMRTIPNMYILNLAISDIIYLNILFSEALRLSVPWPSYGIWCSLVPFFYRMSVVLTAYSIAVLSIQRYRVTVNPLHVRVAAQPTWRVTGATICGLWIVAALFAVPTACSRILCSEYILLWRTKYYQPVTMFELLVSCVLPLCVIAFTYIMTACHLVTSPSSLSEETQNPQLNTRKGTTKVVLGLIVVFLISYFPHHIWRTYLFFNINFDNSIDNLNNEHFAVNLADITSIQYLLLLTNSCLNPVALFCTSLAFRRQFKRYLTCCCKTKSHPTVFELSRRT